MGITQEKAVLKVEVQGSAQAERLMRSFGLTTEKEMDKAGKSTEGNLARMAASYLGLAKGIQLASKAITSGVNFNNFVQNQTMAFTVMMKSADLAKAKLSELYDFAVNSPLTFKETVGASKSLLAYGFAAEELVPTMKTLGTVAMATGHSLDDISYVYGTLRSQGRAYTRDLMQFGMRGIPIYEELAKVMNVNVKDLKKLTEEGKVGFPQVEQAMKNMTAEGGRFGGMLEESMKTVTGQYSMLVDIAQQSAGALTKGLTEQFIPAMKMLNKALSDNQDNLATIGSAMGSVFAVAIESAAKLIDLLVIMKPVIIAIGAYLLATAIPGIIAGIQLTITSIGVLSAALMASPLGPWIIALTAAAVAATWAWNAVNAKIKANADATRAASKELEIYNNQMELMGEKRMGRSGSAKALAPPTDEMNDYMDKLRDQYAKYLAERQRDEKYIIDAVVNYERMKKLEEARKLFGEGSPLFNEAKRYIDAMADYEVKQLKDAQKKAWEESLADYQAQYDKVIAQQHVEDMSNIYAVADLEYAATKKTIDEKFKGNEKYKNQALEIAKKLHDITMENIKVENDRRIQDVKNQAILAEGNRTDILTASRRKSAEISQGSGVLGYSASTGLSGVLGDLPMQALALSKYIAELNGDIRRASESTEMLAQQDVIYFTGLRDFTNNELKRLKEAADKLIDTMKREAALRKFESMKSGDPQRLEDLQIAASQGGLEGAAATMGSELSGTDMGKLAMGADPLTMIAVEAAKFLMSIENVSKSLNFIGTIFEGMRALLEPVINTVFSGFVSYLMEVGDALGQILLPFFTALGIVLQTIYGIAKITIIPVLKVIGAVFTWLSDKILVPFGNFIIDMLNGLIGMMNKFFEFTNKYLGTNIQLIAELEHLLTSEEAYNYELAKKAEELRATRLTEALGATIAFLIKTLDDLADAQVQSAQDLYEVGAISGTQYGSMVDAANETRRKAEADLVTVADKQLAALGDQGAIATRLDSLLAAQKTLDTTEMSDAQKTALLSSLGLMTGEEQQAYVAQVASQATVITGLNSTIVTMQGQINTLTASVTSLQAQVTKLTTPAVVVPEFERPDRYVPENTYTPTSGGTSGSTRFERPDLAYAVGTSYVPSDMTANIHKGEVIVPRDFADGIRSGELSLSGRGGSSAGGDTYIINVAGSVTTENDLASAIAKRIHTQRSRGLLTV